MTPYSGPANRRPLSLRKVTALTPAGQGGSAGSNPASGTSREAPGERSTMRKTYAALAVAVTLLLGFGAVGSADAQGQSAVSVVTTVGADLTPPALPANPEKPLKGVKLAKGKPGKAADSKMRLAAVTVGINYNYVIGSQTLPVGANADGMAYNHIVYKSFVGAGDYHSLTEGAVFSRDGKQIIEAGTTTDPAVCGSTGGVANVCVFTYTWKNGVPQGYNTGFVPYAPTCSVAANYCAGEDAAGLIGAQPRTQIIHSGTVWWVAFNGLWIGYFPDTMWTNATPNGPSVTFNKVDKINVFGEVAWDASTTADRPCTDMSSGVNATAANTGATPAPGRIGTIAYQGLLPAGTATSISLSADLPGAYDVYSLTAPTNTTFQYGGRGYTNPAPGTPSLPGVKGGC